MDRRCLGLAYPLEKNCIECRDLRDRLDEGDMAFEKPAGGSAVFPAVDTAVDSAGNCAGNSAVDFAGNPAVDSAGDSAVDSAPSCAVGTAAGSAVGLRLDIDLSSGNYSDFEGIQTDFAGDNIARQDQDALELLCIRLKFRFPRAYR
jgi:hypothetical protein